MALELFQFTIIFAISLFVLLKASDFFIDSAEKIGLALGVSPFVVGITIVAFGPSLPELATSVTAVLAGESSIVLGNVVGSNIANILLVFGLTAFVAADQLKVGTSILKLDIPVLLIASAGLYYAVSDGDFSTIEGVTGLVLLAIYLFRSISQDAGNEERTLVAGRTYLIFLLAGVFVFLGSKYTIVGIEGISTIAGISPDLIALSMVALGTSLPEVVVSLQAAKRGKAEIALGNVIGSNIFNILAVMGLSRFAGSLSISDTILGFSLPFMMAVTVLLALLCVRAQMKKWIGAAFMAFYVLYIIYISIEAL
jgi:cation:H+ antiporter